MATSTPRWVKLRSMPTPWPACVYDDYSAAARCLHEIGALRAAKPVLDVEDRVVFFFGVGVGARAVRARGTGVAPNLQLCVAHADDMADAAFEGKLGFGPLCRELGLPEDVILRTEMSSVFQRACAEAEKLAASAKTDEQATRLFVDLVKDDTTSSSGRKSALDETLEIERPVPVKKSAPKPPLARAKSVAKPAQTQRLPASQTELSLAEVLASPQLEGLAAKCWQLMLDAEWEVMAQANGEELYKMPGISFFEFQPNVNIFDSRDKACAQFLKNWIHSAAEASGKETNQADLVDFVWPLMVEGGWQTMASANETWFIMPNTPFDKCVPNVTIFRGKEQAVAKFLEDSGLGAPTGLTVSQPEEPEEDSDMVSNDGTEVLEEGEEENEQEDNSQEVSSQECSSQEESDADSDTSEEHDEDEDEDEDEEEEDEGFDDEIAVVDLTKAPKPSKQGPSRSSKIRSAGHPKVKRFVALSPEKSEASQPTSAKVPTKTKPTTKPENKPEKAIPAFKLSFGKIEAELRLRGWFWRQGNLDWHYYKPQCKGQADSKLKIDQDYFVGREMLQEFLNRSGLIDSIHEAQLLEHKRQYLSDDSDNEDSGRRNASSRKAAPASTKTHQQAKKASAQRKAKPQRKRSLPEPGSSRRKRQRSVTSTNAWEPNFGLIWEKLQEEGWHLKNGSFGYDFFKPTCQGVNDGERNVDFFHSEEELTDYLRNKTDIWRRVAKELKAQEAMSDAEDGRDDEQETGMQDDAREQEGGEEIQQRGHKRKNSRDETDDIFDLNFEVSSISKKQCNSSEFRTPIAVKRALAPSTKAVTVNTPAHDETISPDATGLKESEHASAPSSALPRNLANIFTPSPNNLKKGKLSEKNTSELTPSPVKEKDPVSAAIKRLTASYTPRRFRYRESEFAEIRGFFRQCFMQRRGASLYISGAPGCGKTALLKSTEGDIDELHKECFHGGNARLVRLHVNAMAVKDTGALLCELAEAATKRAFEDPEEAFDAIEAATSTASKSKRHTTLVLVLDEMDTLLSRNGVESDLCRLFELAQRPSHAFVLIGIANQVDITERHLPLLKERLPDCRPRVLVFKAYSHETIEQILVDRLGGKQEASKMLNAHGITFLARKIASTTGDIRLALDTCRRILQHKATREAGAQDKENVENRSLASAGRPMALTDMLRLIKHALESKSSLIVQSLPRNLQMILFASTRLVGSQHGALVGVDELYASYRDVCDAAGVLSPLSEREFRGSLDILSAESLLAPAELKRQLVKPSFSASELLQGFRADAYFSRLI